jgi:hypothetical protein
MIDATGAAGASVRFDTLLPGALSTELFLECFGGPPGFCNSNPGLLLTPVFFDQVFVFTFNIRVGVEETLGLRLSTSVRLAAFTGSGSADALFGSTLGWNGIHSVKLQGNPVDFTLTSETGIDWTQPQTGVPEPATAALLATGLTGALAARSRRRFSS